MTGQAVDPESVTSRGWRITQTGWDHVIELGREPLAIGRWQVFIDDHPLATMPMRTWSGRWEHPFSLDGRPAVLRASIEGFGTEKPQPWAWSLTVDGVQLGPPEPIVGRPDRPAVGTPAARRRRQIGFAGVLLVAGLVSGSVVPAWDEGTTSQGPVLVLLIAGFLVASLLAVPAAAIQAVRGRRSSFSRGVLWYLLPFDVGIVIGVGVSVALGVGSEGPATGTLFSLLGLLLGVLLAAAGLLGIVSVLKRRALGTVTRPMAVALVAACLGLLAFGLGLVLVAVALISGDPSGVGYGGPLFVVGGLACLLIGGAIFNVEQRRTRTQTRPSHRRR